jgi:hypothetical protein
MRFRLTYEGPLMGNANADHKHGIRRVFHRQLRRLWDVYPGMSGAFGFVGPPDLEDRRSLVEKAADNFSRNGYRFLPLVSRFYHHPSVPLPIVSMDILFLRSGAPGGVIKSADLDGRLKTLLDSLRMPEGAQELGSYTKPEDGENPFYVLIDDDKYIGNVSVTTDTLLEPTARAGMAGHNDKHDSRLVISIRIESYDRVHLF